MKFLFLSLLVFAVSVVTRGTDAPVPPTFSGEQVKLKETMTELFETSKNVNAAEPERKKARDRVEKALDWDRIARDSLGKKRWDATSAAHRNEYKSLLQEVVVRTAYSRLDKFWKETKTYDFQKIDLKGNTAHVAAKFVVDKEDFLLEYFLNKTGSRWTIYDIAFEDLKYSENIGEQISAFMKENNFAKLLEKLRKRRDELKEEKPAATETKKS